MNKVTVSLGLILLGVFGLIGQMCIAAPVGKFAVTLSGRNPESENLCRELLVMDRGVCAAQIAELGGQQWFSLPSALPVSTVGRVRGLGGWQMIYMHRVGRVISGKLSSDRDCVTRELTVLLGRSSGIVDAVPAERACLDLSFPRLNFFDRDRKGQATTFLEQGKAEQRILSPELNQLLVQRSAVPSLQRTIARTALASVEWPWQWPVMPVLRSLSLVEPTSRLHKVAEAVGRKGDTNLAFATVVASKFKAPWIAFVQASFEGLSLASILILMGLGLSIIFGLMRVINMAHGEFMMIGAFSVYAVSLAFERWLPEWAFDYYWLIAIPTAFIASAGVGWLCEALIIRHLHGRELDSMLATWGISLALIQTARLVFGDTTSLTPPSWFVGGWEVEPGLVLPVNRIFIILYAAGCVLIATLVIHRTRYGRLLRAASQNRETADLLGVNVNQISRFAFAFGAGMAGLAGCAVVLVDKLNPQMGQGYLVDSFLVVVGGGIGKIAGVVLAGVGLGFVTKYLEPFLQAVYGKVFVLLLVIVLIRLRPSGLFAQKGRLSDD